MLTSNGTTENIAFFVKWVRDASPEVRPAVIMTDCDQAQINALETVYPQSRIFLCHWHVLRAIRSHFVTTAFEALWQKIKALVRTDNQAIFDRLWYEIWTDPSVPPSVVKYLNDMWMKRTHMWSKVFRKNLSIFEEGDTNMLIEAWVNHSSAVIR
jgi:MULE transposase domain